MKKILSFLILLSWVKIVASQDTNKLMIQFSPYDLPFQELAIKTVENTTKPQTINYFKSLLNPSMHQSLDISTSYYNSIFYALSKIKINWFNSYFFNYLTESIIETGALTFSEYLPLGDSWLHEEYHRAVLTKNIVNSYNQVYDFPIFSSVIMVYDVTDEDLIRFKSKNPADFVRLSEAGIEGEYALTKKLQGLNFFENQDFRYFPMELLWTVNSIYYVWFCHTEGAETETIQANIDDGDKIKNRDFTGLDFTAWTYDLFKPYEAYQIRGLHPSGVGIDRYIKPSDLTNEELKYLKRQGYWQFLNLASPMLIGIDKINLSNKIDNLYFNFAFRDMLTSFGNDLSLNIFLKRNELNLDLNFHLYNNQNMHLPGFDVSLVNNKLHLKNFKISNTYKAGLWYQPENLMFGDNQRKPGGIIETVSKIKFKKIFFSLDLSYKSQGWVMANVFEEKNFSILFGLGFDLNK